jgi:hypothetical protein
LARIPEVVAGIGKAPVFEHALETALGQVRLCHSFRHVSPASFASAPSDQQRFGALRDADRGPALFSRAADRMRRSTLWQRLRDSLAMIANSLRSRLIRCSGEKIHCFSEKNSLRVCGGNGAIIAETPESFIFSGRFEPSNRSGGKKFAVLSEFAPRGASPGPISRAEGARRARRRTAGVKSGRNRKLFGRRQTRSYRLRQITTALPAGSPSQLAPDVPRMCGLVVPSSQ